MHSRERILRSTESPSDQPKKRKPKKRAAFLSYARADKEMVTLAANLLKAGGARIFMDVVDIEYGDQWATKLHDAIKNCERVLVFWSSKAAGSLWVEREWRLALELEKRIIPVLLDETELPLELAQFHAMTEFLNIAAKAKAAGVPRFRAWAPSEAEANASWGYTVDLHKLVFGGP